MLVLDSPRFGSLSSSVLAELTMAKRDDRESTTATRRANTVSAEKSNTEWNRCSSELDASIVLHAHGHGTNRFPMDYLRIRWEYFNDVQWLSGPPSDSFDIEKDLLSTRQKN